MDNEVTEEQLKDKLVPLLATHFWWFYAGSILIALLICFYHVFSVLPRPVIAAGVTTGVLKRELHYYSRYGRRGTATFFLREINFTWHGKTYKTTGGWNDNLDTNAPVKVIFDAAHPDRALELNLFGLLDFQVFRYTVPAWIFFSGLLFAFASADSHFTTFNFKIPTLTKKAFACILIIILLVPLLPSVDLLVFGKKADGVMNGELQNIDGRICTGIVFNAGGNQYSMYSTYADEFERGDGKHYTVLYRPDNPNLNCLYEFEAMYSNNYVVLVILGLIVVVSWFLASRSN